jgi:hypothetical protein
MVNEAAPTVGSRLGPVAKVRPHTRTLSGAGSRPITLSDRLLQLDLGANGANARRMRAAGDRPVVVKWRQRQSGATMRIRFQFAPAAPVVAATKGES